MTSQPSRSHRTQELLGRGLLALAALSAAVATVFAVSAAAAAVPADVDLWWRALGLPVFAGLFALLAVQPWRGVGLWGLVIANKLALTAVGAVLSRDPAGLEVLVVDGALAVVLVAALLLTRGWRRAAPGDTAAPPR